MAESWRSALASELEALARADALRHLRPLVRLQGKTVVWEGRCLVNGSSNDYLGLAQDRNLLTEFYATQTLENTPACFSLGAASSRLLTGNHAEYVALEENLARAYGREASLVFSSGYHANLGILAALAGPQDAIFADRLNHASLLDGARLSGAKLFRYNHRDADHLETLLKKHRGRYRRGLLVTESVFSMDGDLADLPPLAELRDRYDLFLYVDEAHAAGVFGNQGWGVCEAQGVIPRIDLILGTFGKAWGSLGAYAVGDRVLTDYLVNKARPFIFTTGLPPVVVHWNRFVLERMPSWNQRRAHVLALAGSLRASLAACGLATGGQSQIVPVVVGSNAAALAASRAAREAGLLLLPIRPPTVPPGGSRLRISVTAALDWEDVRSLPVAIQEALKIS